METVDNGTSRIIGTRISFQKEYEDKHYEAVHEQFRLSSFEVQEATKSSTRATVSVVGKCESAELQVFFPIKRKSEDCDKGGHLSLGERMSAAPESPENNKDDKVCKHEEGELGKLEQADTNPDSAANVCTSTSETDILYNPQEQQKMKKEETARLSPSVEEPEMSIGVVSAHTKDMEEQKVKMESFSEKQVETTEGSTSTAQSVASSDRSGKEVDAKTYPETRHAEICSLFIFEHLKLTAEKNGVKLDRFVLENEDSIKYMPKSSGFSLMYLKATSDESDTYYPIFVGVANNFRTVFSTLKAKQIYNTGCTFFKIIWDTPRKFPQNHESINGLQPKLYVNMLELTYPTSKFLKESLLEQFSFCLNKKSNDDIRLIINTSRQRAYHEIAAEMNLRATWNKGIEQCKNLEIK